MSCLFESLGKFVHVHPKELRFIICVYLSTNPDLAGIKASECVEMQPDIPSDSSDNPLAKYIHQMSQTHVMGGAIEITAFCQLYKHNVRVNVIHIPNSKSIEFTIDESYPWATVTWNGGHYEPVL